MVSEGSTLALTVGSPSAHRRYSALKHLAFMLLFLLGSLNVWGADATKAEGFETATAGNDYQGDASVATSESDCGISWAIHYGCVSTSSKITGNNSAALRLYKTGDFGYLNTTTAISGLTEVSFNAKAATSNGAEIKIDVNYSTNGTNWSPMKKVSATGANFSNQGLNTTASNYTAYIPSGVSGNIYFQIAINSGSTRPTKSGTQLTIDDVVFTYDDGSAKCSTPTFSPVAGAVASGTEVTISSTTEGATIYYTTDGITEPTTSSATAQPIEITAATTIKAIAVKDGYDNSDVATAAYTIATPKTIAQVLNDISGTEGDAFLLNDVTVTYVSGTNIYVKDASGYILVYDKNSAITSAANGKVLRGLWGKAKTYNGLPEISTVTQAPTVIDGSAVEPEDLTNYPTDGDLNKYVTLEGVTFASAATLSGSVTNVTGIFDGSNLIFRNTFELSGISLATGKSYRVVGVVQKYNTNYQVYPISFEEQADPTVTLTPAALDFGTIGVEDDAPAALTFTVSGSNLTENLTASVTAGSDYYDIAVTPGSLNQDGGTVSATITVTPKSAISASAGTKAGTVTVSGNGLSETVSLTTEVKAKHTVTWNNNGTPSTTQVIDGEKPSFPATPASCDATSTTFVGWATAPWEDKIDDLAGKTVHASNATMDAVTTDDIVYYAVFAKSAGGAFDGTTGGEFYIYADIDDTKYYAKAFASKIESTTDIAEAVKYTFEKIVEDETTYFAIKSGDYYLGWSSSTNFTTDNA